MPLDGNGVASKPAGATFAPNTLIESSKVNALADDIYSILNTARPITKGGTGATNAAAARVALGLEIGVNVMAYSADISDLVLAWVPASASGPASLAFAEDTDNGAHKITVKAPAALAADQVLTLPDITDTLVGLAAAQELTNKTLTQPTLTLKQGAAPAPTAEGDIQWDTDDNVLVIGDGAAAQVFVPVPASTAAGDIEYFTGAKAKARLAKGTAAQVLTMNAGATAPEWATPDAGWDMTGQSWSTPARTVGTSYQNTTGKPIMVALGLKVTSADAIAAQVSINNSTWVTVLDVAPISGTLEIVGSFVVPPGHYYRAQKTAGTGGSIRSTAVLS